MFSIFIIVIFLSAFIHIRAEYFGPPWHIYIFKPLTMVFIIMLAVFGSSALPHYRNLIIVGLVFSMAGDVFLMLPSDRFVAGLIAFLIAHLFYIVAFVSKINTLIGWPLISLITYGIVIYLVLSSYLGKMKMPVVIYIVVILVMAWSAWEWWAQAGTNTSLLAFLGAVLFVVSDTILAVNRFRRKFKLARVLNLSTYFTAQLFISSSAGGFIF